MKIIRSLLLAILLLGTCALASEITTAQVISVKKYDRGRIGYWEGNVPIYDDRPVYDITIKVAQKNYTVRYESYSGYYPSAWKVGSEIKIRKERGQFVLLDGEEEVTARTVSPHDCNPSSVRPSGWTSTTELPCD
jgi:hypothetical protein